jgi:hypothetical protein
MAFWLIAGIGLMAFAKPLGEVLEERKREERALQEREAERHAKALAARLVEAERREEQHFRVAVGGVGVSAKPLRDGVPYRVDLVGLANSEGRSTWSRCVCERVARVRTVGDPELPELIFDASICAVPIVERDPVPPGRVTYCVPGYGRPLRVAVRNAGDYFSDAHYVRVGVRLLSPGETAVVTALSDVAAGRAAEDRILAVSDPDPIDPMVREEERILAQLEFEERVRAHFIKHRGEVDGHFAWEAWRAERQKEAHGAHGRRGADDRDSRGWHTARRAAHRVRQHA